MQSKQAATIRCKGLASSLNSTAEMKPHMEPGRWTGNCKPVLHQLVWLYQHHTKHHASALVQSDPISGGKCKDVKGGQ